MARPKSDERRNAILSAAIRVIAADGLGAATANIAKEAGVSNGSLFTYFGTKSDLLNQAFLELKVEMAAAALDGLPIEADVREQLFYMWSHWLEWATSHPEKRRALVHLEVSDDITLESRQEAGETMACIATLLQRSRENGPMRDASLAFVVSLMSSMADATVDFMLRHPAKAKEHSKVAFEALWRMIA